MRFQKEHHTKQMEMSGIQACAPVGLGPCTAGSCLSADSCSLESFWLKARQAQVSKVNCHEGKGYGVRYDRREGKGREGEEEKEEAE